MLDNVASAREFQCPLSEKIGLLKSSLRRRIADADISCEFSVMDGLREFPFETSNWPPFLADLAPQGWVISLFLLICIIAYCVGFLVKRGTRTIGRKIYGSKVDFQGSSWDLSAPVIQLLVFLLVFTVGAELFGFDFGDKLLGFWPRALAALIIVAGAVFFATWINRSLRSYGKRAHLRNKVDDTLIEFTASVIRYAVLGVAMMMALTQFGFAPGSIIAIVGAAGLAIALALQDTLKAVAAGFMIAAFRPFRIGDWVQLGSHEGEVAEITPFTTSINEVDNKRVVITNDRVWGDAIVNHTKLVARRLDLYFEVHYDTDLDHALRVLRSIAVDHDRILRKADTWVGVHELLSWSISLRLRAWVPSREFVQVRSDITKTVKETFSREGIEIPYPHQVEYFKEGLNLKTRATEADD